MIIRTNLYWEFAEQPPTDPWKGRAIMAAMLLVLLAAGYWYFLTTQRETWQQNALAAENRYAELQAQLATLRERVQAVREKAEARAPIIDYARRRLNFAPVLERVLAAAPANVEFSRLRLMSDGQAGFRLLLIGSGAGEQPRLVCDKLRVQLIDGLETEFPGVIVNFDSLDESTRTIQIEGQKRAVADFTISATWRNAAYGN